MEHLAISFIIALIITAFYGPKIGICITLLLCFGKEFYDLSFNPWGLEETELISDSRLDMLFNVLGVLGGAFVGYRK